MSIITSWSLRVVYHSIYVYLLYEFGWLKNVY